VIDCVCKKDQIAAHGHSCDMPMKRCGFVGMPPAVPLSENIIPREEAIKLWEELDAMGTHIVEGFYGFTMGAEAPQFVGACHCCGCCCCILNAARLDNSLKETVQCSNYRAVKDNDKCTDCGVCVRRCQVFAQTWDKTEEGEVAVYSRDKCVGCGACIMGCKFDALHLEPVPEEEWFHVASSFTEWEEQRLEYLAAQKK
jgi:electron transport complex protein RnfB